MMGIVIDHHQVFPSNDIFKAPLDSVENRYSRLDLVVA